MGNTKRNIPSRRGGPRARRFAGNIPTVSPSLWRNHPRLVLGIWTRRSTWFPPISLLASSISSSGRGSVSDPRTLSSSLSTTSSPPPPPPWGRCTRNTMKRLLPLHCLLRRERLRQLILQPVWTLDFSTSQNEKNLEYVDHQVLWIIVGDYILRKKM